MWQQLKPHIKYIKYLLHHKWHVCVACFRMGLYWQGIIHDWSKFLPCEWIPYVDKFYKNKSNGNYTKAWLHHIHFNKHHHEHWVIPGIIDYEEGNNIFKPKSRVVPMPDKYLKEMICDWYAGGKRSNGWSVKKWYEENQYNLILHSESRKKLKKIINGLDWI